jgi:hypothetical protein
VEDLALPPAFRFFLSANKGLESARAGPRPREAT